MKSFICIILPFIFGCAACDLQKPKLNDVLYGASTMALAADWSQTAYIADNPDRFHENNPLLGKHPHKDTVNLYFAGAIIGNTLIYKLVPEKYSNWIFGGVLAVESFCIINNNSIGVGWKVPFD